MALYTAAIDTQQSATEKAIRQRGLSAVSHLWCSGKTPAHTGYKSDAAVALGLKPMPDSFLIDRNGRILFRGHPDFFEERVVPLIEARLK